MDFSESLGYPLKGVNIPKVLTIVLMAVIIGASIFVAGVALQSFWVVLLILPVLLAYSLFVQGYIISVIKSVMDDEEALPAFRLGRDMGRGAILFLASIVYAIPIIIMMVIFFALIGVNANAQSDDVGAGFILVACGGGLAFVATSIVLGFSYIVGQIRYAAEDSVGALFNIGKNFGVVMSNLGKTFGLFIRQFGIAVVFGIFSSIILNVISAFFAGVTNKAFFALSDGNMDGIMELGMPIAIFGSLYYTVSLTINLMQGFSSAHLIAGYGAELGYAPNKLKNDEKGSSMAGLLVVLAVIILLVLVVCGAVFMLATLGPEIGDVFSEVSRELGA